MEPILYLDLPQKCRIIAVSDIHTYDLMLLDMLGRNGYNPDEDYLIIVGDIVEHGEENIRTIRTVMELCRNERAIAVMGNNDTLCVRIAYTYDYDKFMLKAKRYPHNTYFQMAQSIGIDPSEFNAENLDALRSRVNEAYDAELQFVNSLPTAVVTADHIFVHAGIEDRSDWENTVNSFAMAQRSWMYMKHSCEKTVVVGHYPTYNYKQANNTNLPIIDLDRRMIDIDGGLTIKWAAQMNLLNINKDGSSYGYSVFWDTPFEKKTVLRDFDSGVTPVYVDVDNEDLTVIGEHDGFTELRNNISGETGLLISEQVYNTDNGIRVWQNLSAFPAVKRGDRVSLVGSIRDYSFIINKEAQVGWIKSDLLAD